MVPPDLDETKNRVLAGSIEAATAWTADGTVESRTVSLGWPPALPNVRQRTSGPRLLPPIPSRTTSRNPASLIPLPKASRAGDLSRMASNTVSQPKRLVISVGSGFQTVWSRAQMRWGTPPPSTSRIVAATSGIASHIESNPVAGPEACSLGTGPVMIQLLAASSRASTLAADLESCNLPTRAARVPTLSVPSVAPERSAVVGVRRSFGTVPALLVGRGGGTGFRPRRYRPRMVGRGAASAVPSATIARPLAPGHQGVKGVRP